MIDPFKRISIDDRKKLLKNLEATTFDFPKNRSLISSLKGGDVMGIILEGCLQIIRTDSEGNRTIVEELLDNHIFGTKISSLNDDEYDIITVENSTVILIDTFEIYNYLHEPVPYYQQFILNLLEITNSIISERNERIKILTQKTIRNRLLEYFKINSRKTGSRLIYLPFSYTDLADYLAVDRSAMTRELKALKEEGIIESKARKITLNYSSFPALK